MRTLLLAFMAFSVFQPLAAAQVPAGDFVVIVHPDNPDTTLEKSRLDGMFLGKIKQFSDDTEVVPVQNGDESVSEAFSQAVHTRSYQAVTVYWSAMAFKKYVAPPAKLGDDEVVDFVRANRGAIGYVSSTADIGGVATVTVTD